MKKAWVCSWMHSVGLCDTFRWTERGGTICSVLGWNFQSVTVHISFSHMTKNILPLENTICFQKLKIKKIKKSEFDILTMINLTQVHGGTGWARFGCSVSDSSKNQLCYQRKYLERKESWKQLELEIFFPNIPWREIRAYIPVSEVKF